jgi:hypothetical protein
MEVIVCVARKFFLQPSESMVAVGTFVAFPDYYCICNNKQNVTTIVNNWKDWSSILSDAASVSCK